MHVRVDVLVPLVYGCVRSTVCPNPNCLPLAHAGSYRVFCAAMLTWSCALMRLCRGAPLSAGWLSEPHSTGGHTCVVCPYHGWAIDGEGRLQDVPSAEPGHWPKRPIVSAYPVRAQQSSSSALHCAVKGVALPSQ
jgi:hypothetical protein